MKRAPPKRSHSYRPASLLVLKKLAGPPVCVSRHRAILALTHASTHARGSIDVASSDRGVVAKGQITGATEDSGMGAGCSVYPPAQYWPTNLPYEVGPSPSQNESPAATTFPTTASPYGVSPPTTRAHRLFAASTSHRNRRT